MREYWMATNLSIECADRSVRWYLTPGQSSRYEIIVINKSGDENVDCTMSLDEPAEGATFEPASFSLRPRERKIVALTFAETAQVPRDQLTLISVRDSAGDVIASLERGLISAGGIDCTIQLAWKEPILDGNAVRGFVISCAVKSLSATAGQFALQPTPTPSLEFVDVAPIRLEPGQTQTVTIPILWKRSVKDAQGNNHPHVVEIGVAVSQGKRTGRLSWDTIESKLAPYVNGAETYASAAAPAPPQAAASPPEPAQSQTALALEGPPPVAMPSGPAVPPSQAAPPPPAIAPEQVAASVSPPNAPQPDFSNPENDDELMSLLVGKPVSPPDGWRGPGRDAPDAPAAPPPSIYARTPATVPKPQPPPQPPPQQAPPVRVQAPPPVAPPLPPPVSAAPAQGAPGEAGDAVPQPYRRTYVAPGIATNDREAPAQEQPETEGIFGESPLESAVVGPPPSLARAIEAGKERKASARRTIEMPDLPALRSHEGQLGTLAVGGTAIIALALVVVFYLMRPTLPPQGAPQAAPSATVPPAVVLETPPPAQSPGRNNQSKPNASPGPNASGQIATPPSVAPAATASAAAQATRRALATTAPTAAPRPAPTTAHVALAPKPVHSAAPKPRAPRHHYQPANPNIVVSMQGVDAHYGPGGHAVRVLWGANGQAAAHVELTDVSGDVLSSTDVPGGRYNAVLYVPRTYRGSVFVQVVSVGAQGERVTQSTSLPAFSH
jgi:hypothetical protein